MSYLIFGLLVFSLGYKMKKRFEARENSGGAEAMNNILIAGAILILFYGIISGMMIH